MEAQYNARITPYFFHRLYSIFSNIIPSLLNHKTPAMRILDRNSNTSITFSTIKNDHFSDSIQLPKNWTAT